MNTPDPTLDLALADRLASIETRLTRIEARLDHIAQVIDVLTVEQAADRRSRTPGACRWPGCPHLTFTALCPGHNGIGADQ